MQMAKKQRTLERLAEHRRQREEEDRRQGAMAITEFDAGNPEATVHAIAGAILEYRRVLGALGRVVDLAKAGAPVALIAPASEAYA